MSVASWMYRSRNLRLTRSRRTRDGDPDHIKLDLTKSPGENLFEILTAVCDTSGLPEGKVLSHLNNYVKLLTCPGFDISRLKITTEELFCCLRISCVHELTHIRAAGLRAVRYSIKTIEHVLELRKLQFSHIIARSLDLASFHDIERVQALKLIRRILLVAPNHFEIALGRSLISLANGLQEEKDRMLRACLAALSELGVLNSELFISLGGVVAIMRNILECQTPRIAESLCGTLLHLLNHPKTRHIAGIDLQCLAAPYCDFHYKKKSNSGSDRKDIAEEKDLRFNCSRLALLSVLRSWPGILHFCNPTNRTCLKAMVDVLYLEHLEVKNAVLDLLYELLNLPQPEWTDEFSVALNAVDPSDAQDSWRLGDGFVAAEARSLLPHLARTTPNLADIHLAFLLYIFNEVGLLTALAEVIVSGDTFICVRATVLLGVLLHLSHQLLPPDCCNTTPPLPNLLMHAMRQHQALSAVTALQNLHTMLKQRPASSSLFLDHILISSNYFKSTTISHIYAKTRSLTTRSKIYQFVNKDSENLLRDSAVLQQKDGFTWDWDIIRTILKESIEVGQKLDESNHKAFIKKLVHYFKPSSNRFSHMDMSSLKQTQKFTLAGCDLVKYLLSNNEPEGLKFLMELFKDIAIQIDAITSSKSAHDCLFSPQHMSNTCCQKYFLLIGHLTHTALGLDILTLTGISDSLLQLATTTNHDCYVKLIISSMDYSFDAFPRKILAKTLTCSVKSSRLYATQFLLVLIRAKVFHFEIWGVEMLVNQLYDQSKAVSLTALNTLHEACEDKVYLEKLVVLKPDLVHLGDKGLLLLIRFLSSVKGFTWLEQSNFIQNEIKRWRTNYNYRYVRIIEEDLHDCLTLHQRTEDGHYNCRISSVKSVSRRDIFVPPHLYGQLVQHQKGYNALLEWGNLNEMFQCIEQAVCNTDSDILELKAALWACGNVATSAQGVELLVSHNVFQSTINIAKSCPVYALRGTAIYVLGIMGVTYRGANELFKLGWICTRHDRHERWPVIEGENWDLDSSPLSKTHSPVIETESDRFSENSTTHFWNDETTNLSKTALAPDGRGDFLLLADEEFGFINEKSSTLPPTSTGGIPIAKHQRSLSESKTVDVITSKIALEMIKSKLNSQNSVSGNTDKSNEIIPHRHRDYSESSTSGVSSCDSMAGKFVISERIQTLSPIPSSSSLSTITKPTLSYNLQRRRSDHNRPLGSLNSYSEIRTISPTESSRLSYQDLLGYTTLRFLRQHQKPSVKSLNSGEDLLSELLNVSGEKNKLGSSIGSRSYKIRSLDRQYNYGFSNFNERMTANPILMGASTSSLSSMTQRTTFLKKSEQTNGPCYMGISMPRNLLDFFPSEKVHQDDFIGSPTNSQTDDFKADSFSQISAQTIHNTRNCISCCRKKFIENITIFEAFDSYNYQMRTDEPSTSRKDNETEGYIDPRMKIEILKHVDRLSNPFWYKSSRQTLLQLKQKFPRIFQDICLYSEVCQVLTSVPVRIVPRRFIQEIFQDLNFELLLRESTKIINEVGSCLLDELANQSCNDKSDEDTSKTESGNNKDIIDRQNELSELIQVRRSFSPNSASNKIVIVSSNSSNNATITTGFTVHSSYGTSSESSSLNETDSSSFIPVRSPPLASVKEETLSSVEDILNERTNDKKFSSEKPYDITNDTNSEPVERPTRLVSPRGHKTVLDSLSLSCSKNKFPITTRLEQSTTPTLKFSSYTRTTPLTSPTLTTPPSRTYLYGLFERSTTTSLPSYTPIATTTAKNSLNSNSDATNTLENVTFDETNTDNTKTNYSISTKQCVPKP